VGGTPTEPSRWPHPQTKDGSDEERSLRVAPGLIRWPLPQTKRGYDEERSLWVAPD
jgi:hypothetical protein